RLKDQSQTEFLNKVQEQFDEIRVVETGRKLFDIIPDKSSLIVSMDADAVDFNHHARIGQTDLGMEEITYKQSPYSGTHHINGILLIKGPHVQPGIEVSGASILDVTPTVLYLEKMPISLEVDGKILFSAISEDFQKANSPQLVPESVADKVTPSGIEFDKQVEERLKTLGYVQ
ncbi:MAG: hypothetical protein QW303_08610, partial [Nitrososphaerota archaeon]